MDYSSTLGNGMNPSTALNRCEINVRFCFAWYIKAGMYQDLFQFIGCIRNVLVGSFFNVYLYALFEFLFVILNQKLDFSSFFESFIYNKIGVFPLFTGFNSHSGVFHEAITENQLHDFLINSRHSCKKYCLHNSTLWGITFTVDS